MRTLEAGFPNSGQKSTSRLEISQMTQPRLEITFAVMTFHLRSAIFLKKNKFQGFLQSANNMIGFRNYKIDEDQT